MRYTYDQFSSIVINIESVENAEIVELFSVCKNLRGMESDEFYNHVSEKICDFYCNTNFDNIDGSAEDIVCILKNTLNKFCPIIEVNSSDDNDKHKP